MLGDEVGVDAAAGGHLLLSIELFDQFFNPVHIVFVCIHILYVEGFNSFYGHIIRLIVVLEIDKVGFLAALKKKVRVECEVGGGFPRQYTVRHNGGRAVVLVDS